MAHPGSHTTDFLEKLDQLGIPAEYLTFNGHVNTAIDETYWSFKTINALDEFQSFLQLLLSHTIYRSKNVHTLHMYALLKTDHTIILTDGFIDIVLGKFLRANQHLLDLPYTP